MQTGTHSPLEAANSLPPTYQVFVSHGWEDAEVEAILDAFIVKLRLKLSNLPERYRDKFIVKLWFDRGDMNARAKFDDQTDPACAASAFAVFMASDKWFVSQACVRERRHFEDCLCPDGSRPYLFVQLSGNPADHDSQFKGFPSLPGLWNGAFRSVLRLWSKGDLDDRDAFVSYLRDQICEHLSRHGGPV